MKLHTIAKIGGVLSIILFLIGVGMYCFAKLSEAGDGRNMDLWTLVPNDCIGVLETDNLDYFSNEFPQTSYATQLDTLRSSGIIHTILADITQYSSIGAHRLGNQMNHLMVSFHSTTDIHDVVVYFKMGKDAKKLLSDIVTNYNQLNAPKKETYRGKRLYIYPCGHTRFVTVYSGAGFLAVSYHKRLIERVVDAEKDGTSLRNDDNFSNLQGSKSANYMTLYGKTPSLPILAEKESSCWSEFNIHLNSDVFYLSGSLMGQGRCLKKIEERIDEIDMIAEEDFLVVSGQHKVDSCISESIIAPQHKLFEECVSNLSREASYIMVADLEKVASSPQQYAEFVPTFIRDNLPILRSFILSVQITKLENRLSHIFVFTYKN